VVLPGKNWGETQQVTAAKEGNVVETRARATLRPARRVGSRGVFMR